MLQIDDQAQNKYLQGFFARILTNQGPFLSAIK